MGSNALLRTGKAQLLLGGSFHIHLSRLHSHVSGQIIPHLRDMGGQLWLLCQNGSIYIAYLPARLVQQSHHMVQQNQTIRSLVGRISIREVAADITQSCRPKQGIHDCMGEHIGVRVAQQPQRVRYLYPTQNEFA